jgi:hypothetical protein
MVVDMTRLPRRLATIAVCALAAGALGSASALASAGGSVSGIHTDPMIPAGYPTRTVGADSNHKLITLHRGQKLRVVLDESADGGYRWRLALAPNRHVLGVRGSRTALHDCPAGVVGCSPRRIFRFIAKHHGLTQFRLTESFAGNGQKVAERFTLAVRVR